MPRLILLTIFTMLAFAGNSVLCRLALKDGHIDPLSFTLLRLFSGACILAVFAVVKAPAAGTRLQGTWFGALSLLIYALAFSLAYVGMDAGPGALILFAAVQFTMLVYGLFKGERMRAQAVAGLVLSILGLGLLLLPGSSAPPLGSATLMALSGIAWAFYSLHGRQASSAVAATAGNFLTATPLALLAALPFLSTLQWSPIGATYAVLSGAITSGLGYVLWYTVVKQMTVIRASIVQLSVPVISVLAGVWLIDEPLTLRIVVSCLGVLGGVAMVLRAKAR